MRIIENSKNTKAYTLEKYNNIEDKPTEFLNFVCILCNKYKMKIYKIAKNHSGDRNLGIQLLAIDGYTHIFYSHNKRILELEIKGDHSERIEKDILKYAKTYKYNKGDDVLDEFGNEYVIDENIEDNNISKRVRVISKETGIKMNIYNCSLVPSLK